MSHSHMSANFYKPHVFVIPEDDANADLANGFRLRLSKKNQRQFQVLRSAGGWEPALREVSTNLVGGLRQFSGRHILVLLDFDEKLDRAINALATFPADVRDRIFILGSRDNPEALRTETGKPLEKIGEALAINCQREESGLWLTSHIEHNAAELSRLTPVLRPILFGTAE